MLLLLLLGVKMCSNEKSVCVCLVKTVLMMGVRCRGDRRKACILSQ